jgi:hypothetical protein
MMETGSPGILWFPRPHYVFVLHVVSNPQIAYEGKAQPDEKTQHIQICEYFEEGCNAAIGR